MIANKFDNYKNSPFAVILLAAVISVVMVAITTLVFFESGAYNTVKQIQAGIQAAPDINGDIDTKSPIKAEDIDKFSQSFKNRVNSLDNNSDFGPAALSSSNLGL